LLHLLRRNEKIMDWGDYGDRVYGCWLGKAIGGTLGLATEGIKALADLPMEYPECIEANDDLDLQLVWLDLLKEKGSRFTSEDLASRWQRNITYAVDEYGVVNANIRAGLHPPVTGYYNNWFTRGMGAPIRSEIWACVAPGRPEVAAYFAYQDASTDHWGDGVYGEVFLATLESMAFEESDLRVLINKASEFIPESSEVFQVAQLVMKCVDEGLSLKESRQRILDRFGRENFTDCVQNIGFTLLGLLMGEGDFLKTMIYAINCGFDGDCTGATSGSIMGIILGRKEIERLHTIKMNERIAVGTGIVGINPPQTLTDLTEQTMEAGRQIASEGSIPTLPRPFVLPDLPKFTPPLCLKFLVSTPFGQDASYADAMDTAAWSKAEFKSNHMDLNAFFDGDAPQSVFLRTEFRIPASGMYKLFPSSSDGVALWVDGKQILVHHEHGEFLPALHRPGSPLADVYLESGWHDAVIKVLCCKRPLQFSWIVAREDQHLVMDVEYRAPEGIPASV
jgi:ADP-ribosylglycohydrolase